MTIIIGNKTIETDKNGYLKRLKDWDEEVANQLALNESITLNNAHWEIIQSLRDFYFQYEIAPSTRPMSRYIKKTLGEEKGRSIYLMKLFPGKTALIANKIAGLPRPDNCF